MTGSVDVAGVDVKFISTEVDVKFISTKLLSLDFRVKDACSFYGRERERKL
jgi:hypothetical protein